MTKLVTAFCALLVFVSSMPFLARSLSPDEADAKAKIARSGSYRFTGGLVVSEAEDRINLSTCGQTEDLSAAVPGDPLCVNPGEPNDGSEGQSPEVKAIRQQMHKEIR